MIPVRTSAHTLGYCGDETPEHITSTMIDPPQSRESSKKKQLSWLLMAHQKLNRRYPARYDARRRHRLRHLSSSKMNQAAATTTTNSRRPRKTTTLHSTRLRKQQTEEKREGHECSPRTQGVVLCVCPRGRWFITPGGRKEGPRECMRRN